MDASKAGSKNLSAMWTLKFRSFLGTWDGLLAPGLGASQTTSVAADLRKRSCYGQVQIEAELDGAIVLELLAPIDAVQLPTRLAKST